MYCRYNRCKTALQLCVTKFSVNKEHLCSIFLNKWHSSHHALMMANACTKADTCFHRCCLILSNQFEKKKKRSTFPKHILLSDLNLTASGWLFTLCLSTKISWNTAFPSKQVLKQFRS